MTLDKQGLFPATLALNMFPSSTHAPTSCVIHVGSAFVSLFPVAPQTASTAFPRSSRLCYPFFLLQNPPCLPKLICFEAVELCEFLQIPTMAPRVPNHFPNSLTSDKCLTFLDLPNEVHIQIYKYLFDAARRDGRDGESVRISDEKTKFPQVASALLSCRRCYLEGKQVILSNYLVRLENNALHKVLHRCKGRPDFSKITKLFLPIWRNSFPGHEDLTGYVSCQRLREMFPRLAQLEVDICYTEHCTFPFDKREVTDQELARKLWDTVPALMRGAFPTLGDCWGESPYLLWLGHMVLTRMSNQAHCPFDTVLLVGLEISDNYPRYYTVGT